MLAALGIDARYYTCFLVMAAYLFARPVNILAMNFMRARGQVLLLNLTNLAIRVLEIAVGFTLLLWIVGELYGYLLGVAVVQVAATVFLLGWLLRHHSFALSQVSAPLTYKLLGFGIPLLLTELAYLLLSYADRFMIVAFNGQATLGAYTVGYNVPSYINDLVMFSLSYAIVPIYTELYGREGKAATEVFLSRAADYYLMIVLPICIGYAAISRDALVVLASTKYADAAGFSPLILLGLIFLGFNYILYAGLYLEKKTTQILAIMVVAVFINIAANLYLVPRYQAYGAAVATLIACIVATVLTAMLGRRYLRVSPSLASFAYYLATSCAMYLIVTSIDLASSWLNLLAKISTGVVLMAIAAVARERDIRNVIVRRLRAAQGGLR